MEKKKKKTKRRGFVVEKVIDQKLKQGKLRLLVKWRDLDNDFNTWMPKSYFDSKQLKEKLKDYALKNGGLLVEIRKKHSHRAQDQKIEQEVKNKKTDEYYYVDMPRKRIVLDKQQHKNVQLSRTSWRYDKGASLTTNVGAEPPQRFLGNFLEKPSISSSLFFSSSSSSFSSSSSSPSSLSSMAVPTDTTARNAYTLFQMLTGPKTSSSSSSSSSTVGSNSMLTSDFHHLLRDKKEKEAKTEKYCGYLLHNLRRATAEQMLRKHHSLASSSSSPSLPSSSSSSSSSSSPSTGPRPRWPFITGYNPLDTLGRTPPHVSRLL